MVNISMLIISTIWLVFDLSVSCVPRPCLYMLGSSSEPKCFACVNLAYTCCMWTSESITPDHHVVLRNNEPSQRCTVRGNTFLKFYEGSSYVCYRHCKQIRCKHDKHHMQIQSKKHHMQIINWHDMANIMLLLLISIFGAPWSSSSPAWHHDLHHRVFMKLSHQLLLLLLWLTVSNKVK